MGPRGPWSTPVMMHCWPILEGSLSPIPSAVNHSRLEPRTLAKPPATRHLDPAFELDSTRRGQNSNSNSNGPTGLRGLAAPSHLILVAVVCTVLLLGVACRRRSLLLCDTFRFLFHSPLTSSSATRLPTKIRADHTRHGRIAQFSCPCVADRSRPRQSCKLPPRCNSICPSRPPIAWRPITPKPSPTFPFPARRWYSERSNGQCYKIGLLHVCRVPE